MATHEGDEAGTLETRASNESGVATAALTAPEPTLAAAVDLTDLDE